MQTTTTSTQFTLNIGDIIKGFAMSAITPAIAIIADSLNQGSLTFNWHMILVVALSGGVGYLVKNFFTPSSIKVSGATATQVQAVKDGAAEATIIQKP